MQTNQCTTSFTDTLRRLYAATIAAIYKCLCELKIINIVTVIDIAVIVIVIVLLLLLYYVILCYIITIIVIVIIIIIIIIFIINIIIIIIIIIPSCVYVAFCKCDWSFISGSLRQGEMDIDENQHTGDYNVKHIVIYKFVWW